MRIGIITFHRAYNCGAILQACALSSFLRAKGHSVYLVDGENSVGAERAHFPHVKLDCSSFLKAMKSVVWYLLVELLNFGSEDVKRFRFRRFVRKHFDLLPIGCVSSKTIDCLIVGSDQVWNEELVGTDAELFLCESLPADIPKISYAASVGDHIPAVGFAKRIATAVSKFAAVSVREPVEFELQDSKGRDAVTVVDPSLLNERGFYRDLLPPKRICRQPFLFVYLALECPEAIDLAKSIARSKSLKVVIIDASQRGLWRCSHNVELSFSPDRFLSYIRDAECILTNSFHGTALSIVFGKRFAVLPTSRFEGLPRRVECILNDFNLKDRVIWSMGNANNLAISILARQLPTTLSEARRQLVESSSSWIEGAIKEVNRGSRR